VESWHIESPAGIAAHLAVESQVYRRREVDRAGNWARFMRHSHGSRHEGAFPGQGQERIRNGDSTVATATHATQKPSIRIEYCTS
jgi:hypothetical protein